MNQRTFNKNFDKMIGRLNDQMAHEQAWIEERNSEKLTGPQAVAAAEVSVAWQAIAGALDQGRAPGDLLLAKLRDALWDRQLLLKLLAKRPRARSKTPSEIDRVMPKKTSAQLDREIGEALTMPRTKRSRLSPEVAAAFASMAEDAETYAGENLVLGQRDLGYTGDRKEFRVSDIFARELPSTKYEQLVEYIDEYSRHPYDRLGRTFTAREADELRKEASRIRDEERAYLRGKIA